MVESPPPKRGTRVRFPDDADYIFHTLHPVKIRVTRKYFDTACQQFKIFILRNGMSLIKLILAETVVQPAACSKY